MKKKGETQPHICSENRMFKIDFRCRRKIEFIKKGGSEYLEGHLSHISLFMRMSGIEKWNKWFVFLVIEKWRTHFYLYFFIDFDWSIYIFCCEIIHVFW